MSTFGLFGLVIAFAGVAIGSVCLLASQALRDTRRASSADTFAWAGAVAHILAFVALTFCCGLLVFCFMTGDFSIEYVLLEHSEAEGALGVLYRFAGLWAGREGSLLLWAWLISAFNVAVAVRVMKHDEPIDCMARVGPRARGVCGGHALLRKQHALHCDRRALYRFLGPPHEHGLHARHEPAA